MEDLRCLSFFSLLRLLLCTARAGQNREGRPIFLRREREKNDKGHPHTLCPVFSFPFFCSSAWFAAPPSKCNPLGESEESPAPWEQAKPPRCDWPDRDAQPVMEAPVGGGGFLTQVASRQHPGGGGVPVPFLRVRSYVRDHL